jgi:hypothetical protein
MYKLPIKPLTLEPSTPSAPSPTWSTPRPSRSGLSRWSSTGICRIEFRPTYRGVLLHLPGYQKAFDRHRPGISHRLRGRNSAAGRAIYCSLWPRPMATCPGTGSKSFLSPRGPWSRLKRASGIAARMRIMPMWRMY